MVSSSSGLKENPFKKIILPGDAAEIFGPKGASKFDMFSVLEGPEKMMHEVNVFLPFDFKGQALVNCDSSNSKDVLIGLGKFVLNSGAVPVFVLMGNNYKTVSFLAENNGIKDYFIIDTISKSIMPVCDTEKFFFVDSLRNLTEIQIRMLNIIESGARVAFVFDSLSVLSLYHSESIALKFIYSLTKLLNKKHLPGFYISVRNSSAQKLAQFFDEVVKIKKTF